MPRRRERNHIMQTLFEDPAWYNAVTFTERLASLRATQIKTSDLSLTSEVAQRRLGRWRAQNPFAEDALFAQRLANDGASENEFLHVLGETVETVHGRTSQTPSWLTEITDAYRRSISSRVGDPALFSESERNQGVTGFLVLIEPLIIESLQRLQQGIRKLLDTHVDVPFDPGTIQNILFANLPMVLGVQLSRTLALEVNVARIRGLLQGATPEERFINFISRLQQPEVALEILREYPVLARQLVVHINNWINVSLEFLQHLCADWDAVRGLSPENDPGTLVQVDGGQGDSHRGGRSVMVAHFSSGLRVVHKPKSLSIDTHLQEFLVWLNERGQQVPFRILQVIDRGTYGWTEFVADAACTSKAELERFYERQGGYLALLYALEATDFHYENLIAAGEHPVLIDLESLFHSRAGGDMAPAIKLVTATVGYSVLRVGLLPQRIWSSGDDVGVDLSGLRAPGTTDAVRRSLLGSRRNRRNAPGAQAHRHARRKKSPLA